MKVYTVSLCQSIDAESRQEAINSYIDSIQNGDFDRHSVEAEIDNELTEDLQT